MFSLRVLTLIFQIVSLLVSCLLYLVLIPSNFGLVRDSLIDFSELTYIFAIFVHFNIFFKYSEYIFLVLSIVFLAFIAYSMLTALVMV